MKTIILSALALLLISACAKNDGATSSPPAEVTASGCKMDNPVDIGSPTLLKGENNFLALGNLAFDHFPSDAPGLASDLELFLFEQYFFGFGGTTQTRGFIGFKLTNNKEGYLIGNQPVANTGGSYHNSDNTKSNVQHYVTVRGPEGDPEWKIEVILKGNVLNAVEITHPVTMPNGTRMQEVNCLKQATVVHPFN